MRLKLVDRDTKVQVWHKSLAVRQKAKLFKYVSIVLLITNILTGYLLYKGI